EWRGGDVAVPFDARRTAYILYTSGSSGVPKGVMVPHESLGYYLQWHREHLRPALGDLDLPLSASICFAAGVTQFYTPLLLGRTLHIFRADTVRQPERLVEWYGGHPDFGLYCVPTLWSELVGFAEREREGGREVAGPRGVILSGEAASPQLVERSVRLWPSLRLWNLYGPTEATANATAGELHAGRPVTIGRAIAGTRVYLADDLMREAAPGEPGELCICGEGVATGYRNLPELTAARFVRNPFDADDPHRMFRTGDLARVDERGDLVFIGRKDFQVKIRGYRVECGEIEAALVHHAAVRQAVVLCREAEDGEKRLVAYVTFQFARYAAVDELRAFLAERLPDYMIPASFVMLDAFPKLANGKVDRARLPDPGRNRPALAYAFVPPGTLRERQLVRVWEESLGLEGVGVHDDFFDLGGDSLRAAAAILRIGDALDVDVPYRVFFEHPTPADLAGTLGSTEGERRAPLEPLPARAAYPGSDMQRSLWLLTQTFPELTAYNMQFSLALHGALDIPALEKSIAAVVARHEVLRSALRLQDGRLMQAAVQSGEIALPLSDLTLLSEDARAEEMNLLRATDSGRLFALEAAPLLRLRLVRCSDTLHELLVTVHHAVFDGRSINVFCSDLARQYRRIRAGHAADAGDGALQYRDWVPWQAAMAAREEPAARAFWQEHLRGSALSLTLPVDYPRQTVRRFRGARRALRIDDTLKTGVHRLARRLHATPFMVLLAVFKVLVYRYSGQDDVIVGSPVANRRHAGLEDLVGFFASPLALRTRVSAGQPFEDVVAAVRETCLSSFAHQHFSFEQMIELLRPERSLAQSPIFQVMFAFHERLFSGAVSDGLTAVVEEHGNAGAKYDLVLDVHDQGSGWDVRLTYDRDLYADATIERFLERYASLVSDVVERPSMSIGAYRLTSDADLARIDGWNATTSDNARHEGMCRLFEMQAVRTPSATALVCGEERLSYEALDRRASRLARHLIARGVQPGTLVGIHVEPSVDLVIALLATLKAGAVYVPLDPYYPADRVSQIIDDAGLGVIVAHAGAAARLAAPSAAIVALDTERARIDSLSDEPLPAPRIDPAALMYVMYTSGSTGKPKGVMVPHEGACNYVLWMRDRFPLTAADAVLLKTSINFDIAVWELFLPLVSGARVVVGRREELQAPESLAALIARAGVTQVQFVPSALRAFVDSGLLPACPSIQRIFSGGEALPARLQADVFAEFPRELHNLYGPTEASIYVCHWECRRDEASLAVPIGHPIHNSSIHLLDAAGEPVGIGMTGEVYIGGAGVARGYFGKADLTSAAFVPDRWSDGRLFRTGDLARYRQDGAIEFLGRADRQVKVRGYRIELGEIEHHLAAHPEVKHAIIVVREDQVDDVRLVAYMLYREKHGPAESELRAYLKQKLPDYMVPSTFVTLDAIPLLPNNKANVAALPKPEYSKPLHADLERRYAHPYERELAEIWEEVLETGRFGLEDSFFDVGGHSLLVARLGALIEQRLRITISNIDLFQFPTVR
ncbi:MAG: amino acid adenylation domain-containing protein, partial [Acidobacteriota bacterium]|nr:amino acid adenylation domain-containing protein [Acidobacteriota bacterium]